MLKLIFRYLLNTGRPSGCDVLYYLTGELEVDKDTLLSKLRRHPRWTRVPIIHVGRNLRHLRNFFTDDEIKDNIQVLFYYR